MHDVVRTSMIGALTARLRELPKTPVDDVPAGDCEEALRKLMVVLMPKLSKAEVDESVYTEASQLLCSIQLQARQDIRFLDAFNQFYEVCHAYPACLNERQRGTALSAYRRVIERVLQDQAKAVATSLAAYGSAVEQKKMQGLEGPPRRVLILADNPIVAARIVAPVSLVRGLEVSILICNNYSSIPMFSLRQAAAIARGMRTGGLAFVRCFLTSHWKFSTAAVGSTSVSRWIANGQFDVGLHGMGVIYRRPLLDMFRIGILNAHIGHLPSFRGRSVLEWSLLAGSPPGVTVFLMDEGIDTGEKIVAWRPVPQPFPRTLHEFKQILFDSDGVAYAEGLRDMRTVDFIFRRNDIASGRRYYVMSKLLRALVEKILAAPSKVREREPPALGEPI